MAQKPLLQQLDEIASKVRSLESEKREAATKIPALEREVGKLAALIAQASAKVDEMLKEGATAEVSQPRAVNVPAESKGLGQLGEFSADPRKESKGRFLRAFTLE